MKLFKTLLRKIKYNLKYLFGVKISIPSEFRLFERRKNTLPYLRFNKTGSLKNNSTGIYDNSSGTVSAASSENLHLLSDDRKIFGKLCDNYELSKDIFSNYEFSNKRLKPAFFNVADVKVPYEAARLQSLQKLEIGSIDVSKFPLIYWNSPMDVAIRNINLIFHLLAIEKETEGGLQILGNNKELITSYISQHYEFISNNLEDKGDVVGNHYLIQLTSLLLTIATFSFDDDEDEFNYFVDKLEKELEKQFHEEGTNFEGSTHYSAFVVEALILCFLAIENMIEILEKQKNAFKRHNALRQRIEEIVRTNQLFLSLLTINGELSQIGDNDSGRLFYEFYNEDKPLYMEWLFDLIDDIFSQSIETEVIDKLNLEEEFSHERHYTIDKTPSINEYKKVTHKPIKVFSGDDNFEAYSFKEFGIFIWRNDEQYLSIRCGSIGQNGVGGHSHYDQLAIECFTDGKWIARDPGTGTYTDDIELRNKFRSMEYHWGPKAKIEFPKEDEFDCFRLNYMSNGEVLVFDKNNFLGYAEFNGKKIYRKINIKDGIVTIEDYSKDCDLEEYTSWGEENNGVKVQFSEGYKRIS